MSFGVFSLSTSRTVLSPASIHSFTTPLSASTARLMCSYCRGVPHPPSRQSSSGVNWFRLVPLRGWNFA